MFSGAAQSKTSTLEVCKGTKKLALTIMVLDLNFATAVLGYFGELGNKTRLFKTYSCMGSRPYTVVGLRAVF